MVSSGLLTAGSQRGVAQEAAKAIDLPTSKQLMEPVPGDPKRLNTLPISIAVSPDGRYVVTVNAGYGTFESGYDQSLAVMDTQTGAVADFPDTRTAARSAKQTLYSGLAFSKDGKHLYASMASTSDPLGKKAGDTGTGVAVYSFADGSIAQERMIKIPLQHLAPGRRTKILDDTGTGGKGKKGDGEYGAPFPAAIMVIGSAGAEKLLVADNLSDDVLLLDAATGAVMNRFDLSETDVVPSVYPVALAVTKDESRAFVGLWNSSEVVELDLKSNKVGRKLALLKPVSPIAPGTHPCSLAIAGDGKTMYVALSNRDAVAAVNVAAGQFAVKGYFDTRLPGQTYFGAEPAALAISEDGHRLYVANMGSDALAVIDTAKLSKGSRARGFVEPIGFVPTEWMPMDVAVAGGKIYVATAKGKGTGPNNFPQKQVDPSKPPQYPSTYIATLLYGSMATLDAAAIEKDLKASTAEVVTSNRMKAANESIKFADGSANKIKHVIYIIKENRTYDQVFGDLKKDGRQVGNGDPSLAMYGEEITPNQHALALQFGVLDNFFDSGEVSGDGHVWSNAAIGTDYLEKSWEQDYRGSEKGYDFEGVVSAGYPILQKIPDLIEPSSGYLWTNLAKHHKTLYHFGEYISSTFCGDSKGAPSQDGPTLPGEPCAKPNIAPGDPLPANWGGGVNKWPWTIPRLAKNIATKPELVGHYAIESPDFNLLVPDQIRVQIFEQHLKKWVADMDAGHDTMPEFVMLRLANDHTAGTTPGSPTPKASVADNDLAVGRAVEMISHTKFWDDTAFFILEDDAQNGADHVDAHRSIALVVSKYSPKSAEPFVDSRFYSTVSVVRTMETLLGVPPMNNNDAFSSLIHTVFTGNGDQAAFTADCRNRDNGLIYTANAKTAAGAKESAKMDFSHADRADAQKLNVILWQDAMGEKAVPPMLMEKRKKPKKDDDD